MVAETWITAGLAFATVSLATVSLVLGWEAIRDWRKRQQVLKILRPVAEREGGGAEIGPILKDSRTETEGPLSVLTSDVLRVDETEILLQQAGVDWAVQTFWILSVGLGTALGTAVYLTTASPVGGGVAAAIGLVLPYFYLRRRRTKEQRILEEQLPEAIDLLGRAIRAGHPLSAGIRMVGEEGPDEVAEEFRHVAEEHRFGLPMEDALLAFTDRTGLMDVRIFTTALLVQREVGGNLAEILDKISSTIRSRFEIRRQLRVYTAQGRLTGYVLAVLPIFVGFGIFLLDRDYIVTLFTDPLGKAMVVTAVILQILGYLWIRRIVDIEI